LHSGFASQETILANNTECASVATWTTSVGEKCILLDLNWVLGFDDLDRDIGYIGQAPRTGILAVTGWVAAYSRRVVELQNQERLAVVSVP
jgi:hypothetical protein